MRFPRLRFWNWRLPPVDRLDWQLGLELVLGALAAVLLLRWTL
jgi:hypothetical protein